MGLFGFVLFGGEGEGGFLPSLWLSVEVVGEVHVAILDNVTIYFSWLKPKVPTSALSLTSFLLEVHCFQETHEVVQLLETVSFL